MLERWRNSVNNFDRAIRVQCLQEARECQRLINSLGGVYRVVEDDREESVLSKLLRSSLLGERAGVKEIGPLSALEERLLLNIERTKILTIMDFDGVVFSPWNFLLETAKGNFDFQRTAKVGLANWRFLREIVRASDQTYILTSRRELPGKTIHGFPFIDNWMIKKMEDKIGTVDEPKILKVIPDKPLFDKGERIGEMIEKAGFEPDIIYVVISSRKDREAIKTFLTNNPKFAPRMVIFDTAHLVL